MIKINLLVEKKKGKKKPRGPANFLIPIAIVSGVAVLLMSAVALLFVLQISQLKQQRDANKGALEKLAVKINEVKKFEQLNKDLEQRAAVIEMLKKNQAVPVMILDEVGSIMPEGIWLSSLAYKDNGVSLEGFAFTNIDIVSYIDNLKKSGSFSDVYLNESTEAEVEKVKVYKFKLNFRVKV